MTMEADSAEQLFSGGSQPALVDGPDLGLSKVDPSGSYEAPPYDPTETRESFRGLIALILIGLLAVFVLASFVLFWLHPDRIDQLQAFYGFAFGPIVALVGAATGYYFGSQSNRLS